MSGSYSLVPIVWFILTGSDCLVATVPFSLHSSYPLYEVPALCPHSPGQEDEEGWQEDPVCPHFLLLPPTGEYFSLWLIQPIQMLTTYPRHWNIRERLPCPVAGSDCCLHPASHRPLRPLCKNGSEATPALLLLSSGHTFDTPDTCDICPWGQCCLLCWQCCVLLGEVFFGVECSLQFSVV